MLQSFRNDTKYLASLFKGFSNESIVFFLDLDGFVSPIATVFAANEYIFSLFAILTNLVHLVVLLQKSMRTTSAYIIMAGIALSDVLFPINTVIIKWKSVMANNCDPLPSYFTVFTQVEFYNASIFFRRASSWLGICLAGVRVIVVSFPLNPRSEKLSTVKSGFRIVFAVLFMSFFPSLGQELRFFIKTSTQTRSSIFCPQIPPNTTEVFYVPQEVPFFYQNNAIIRRILLVVDGVISKVIPCICYSLFTVILLRILIQKSRKQKTLSQNQKESGYERTTPVVTLMTVFFFLAEFPSGIAYLIQSLTNSNGVA